MTKAVWESMTPEGQADAWFQELSGMIIEAIGSVGYQPANTNTEVVSGLTTIVAQQ